MRRRITVIGVFRPGLGCPQWVAPDIRRSEVWTHLAGVGLLMTYNGARFDLPVIRDQLGLDLAANLWRIFQGRGDREDVENLEILARRLGVVAGARREEALP